MTMELPPSTAPAPPASAPMPPAPPPASAPTPTPTSPLPPATVRPRRSSSRVLDLALIVAAALAIGGVAFGVGRATAPAVSAANGPGTFRGANGFRPDGSFDPNAAPGRGGAFALGGGLSIDGTVTAVSASAITVKLSDGREVTFTLDPSTAYHQSTAATASDVAVGDDVSVKLMGGRVTSGANPSAAPQLQASDVTVTR
jgi:hypothetical protein